MEFVGPKSNNYGLNMYLTLVSLVLKLASFFCWLKVYVFNFEQS